MVIVEGIIIANLASKNKRQSIEEKINFFRDFWGKFVIYVLATSIIGMFLASLIRGDSITLDTVNNWVSIALGLIALIVGIISLWLSFYNVDQANQAKQAVQETAKDIRTRKLGWQEDGRREWYYVKADGEIARNEWKKSGENLYHLGADGHLDKIIYEEDKRYYVEKYGAMVKNSWIEIDGKKMRAKSDGVLYENEKGVEIDGKIYDFDNGFATERDDN